MTEEEIIKSSSDPTWTEKFRRSPFYTIQIVGVLTVVLWSLFGSTFVDGLFLGIIVCWILFIRWVFGYPVVRDQYPAPFRLLVYWGPPLMVWFFFMGFNAAKSATASSSMPHRLQLSVSEGNGSVSREARILRSFEKWLLIQEKDRQIVWVRSDEVRRIERVTPETPFQGLVCILFDKLCLTGDSRKAKSQ